MNGFPPFRVLCLGRRPEVLEMIVQELRALGLAVEGATEPEGAAVRFDARSFDLVALGGGLAGPVADRLKREFLARNPGLRVLETIAPHAVRDVMAALAPAPAGPLVDLAAYGARVGHRGALTPTLGTLRALCELHAAAIPFEAIDVLLGREVDLTPAVVDAKLIHAGRGGYCFEQNGLLRHVLTALGFEVTGLAARVLWNQRPKAPIARTHMLLRVAIDGDTHLADVGFGGQTLTAPLRLAAGKAQATPHGPYRLIEAVDGFTMQALLGDEWRDLYHFDLQPQLPADYVMFNHFVATHPSSAFTGTLVAARPDRGRRCGLRDNRLTVHHLDGGSERRTLRTVAEMREALETVFLLSLPPSDEVDRLLARHL